VHPPHPRKIERKRSFFRRSSRSLRPAELISLSGLSPLGQDGSISHRWWGSGAMA
jgi:hypothetical protein